MNVKKYSLLALLAALLVFTMQNSEQVQINLFIWKIFISRSLLIFILLLIGFLAGWLVKGHKTEVGRQKAADRGH